MRFPEVTGTNLLRRKVALPSDLGGNINIIFVAFQRWHQALVDSWIPFARQLEASFPGVIYYELPVIYKMNFLSQTFLNEGMRAGIPNRTTRERTITLYLDKESFRSALDIANEETIWVLVVDRTGEVLWRTEGAFSPEKGEVLRGSIQKNYYGNPGASL